ncbi:hypothetical protein CFOLD11_40700 [Clostridium folliculivorans]|uniref:Uncharacterized protein n=1 Tax=Clostridium folliculivorans TaxID=2886038 RepID=A0A9W6DD04_9CLOT|nr:hypothetical protein [Clostridium folliculivorans]GKU27243.1 hypothetical protein CFOLD11_40700 [Clostridium folliculivorans]
MRSNKCMKTLVITLILITCLYLLTITSSKTSKAANYASVNKELTTCTFTEKRGDPSYDYVIGSDYLPHFRVFFWVPKDANKYIPYADKGVKTDVSEHGSVEKWSVIEATKTNGDYKLVYIYVPKTFVILQGKGFQNKIHLEALIINR